MKIRIFLDDTIPLDIGGVVNGLSRVVPSVTWNVGKSSFASDQEVISNPETYRDLSTAFRKEVRADDRAFLFTEKPYDNNYFFDSDDDTATIVSLYGWEHLTNLPRANGIVYFAAALLIRRLEIGRSHTGENTGCINDFWRDKTGVDSGMRAAFICATCSRSSHRSSPASDSLVAEVTALLDDVSHASRAHEDILDYWVRTNPSPGGAGFHVFLCHNSKDKPAVRKINERLKVYGLATWLDEEQLPPGRAWQELLEAQIENIGAVAVFVGSAGIGPWQDVEMRAFISEFVNRRCPVIPVILEGCSTVPQLPLFMRQFTWVDFRKHAPPPLELLIWGITGQKPSVRTRSNKSLKRMVRKRPAA